MQFEIGHAFLIAAVLVHIFAQLRTYYYPLHPDTGHSLYWPLLQFNGHSFGHAKFKLVDGVPLYVGGWPRFFMKSIQLFVCWVALKVFGPRLRGFRIVQLFISLFGLVAMYAWVSLVWGTLAGGVASFSFAWISLSPFWDSMQTHTEQVAVPCFLGALAFMTLSAREDIICFAVFAGVLLVVPILTMKIIHILDLFLMLLYPLFFLGPGGAAFIISAQVILGGALGCIAFLMYGYRRVGSMSVLMSYLLPFSHFSHYKRAMPSDFNIQGGLRSFRAAALLHIGAFCWPYALPCLLFPYSFSYTKSFFLPELFLVGWLVLSAAELMIQRKFYMAHFFPMIAPLAVMAGVGVEKALLPSKIEVSLPLYPIFIISGLLFLYSMKSFRAYYLRDVLKAYLLRNSIMRHKIPLNFIAVELIGQWIKANSAPEDRVLCWGYNHELYAFSCRRAALDDRMEWYLQMDTRISDSFYGPVWRNWLLESVQKLRPRYIVDLEGTLNTAYLTEQTGVEYELVMVFFGIYPLYGFSSADTKGAVQKNGHDRLTAGERALIKRSAGAEHTREGLIGVVNLEIYEKSVEDLDMEYGVAIKDMFTEWNRCIGLGR